MIKLPSLSTLFFLIITSSSFSQKLKKADRALAENLRSHTAFLSDEKLQGCTAGSEGERAADEYIAAQLRKNGLKPSGDAGSWQQKFTISNGREILPDTYFSVNDKPLVLHTDYFPFAFSAGKKAEASVAVALAEAGVPWFVELKDLLDGVEDSARAKDTSLLVAERAKRVQTKGATALIVYNKFIPADIAFNGMDTAKDVLIPVVYIMRPATKKYLSKESSLLDVKMNIALMDRIKHTCNVLATIDNHAENTTLIAARLNSEQDVAALIELSKMLKSRQYRFSNYLFAVYSAENNGADGKNYFNMHAHPDTHKINHTIDLDTINEKGLPEVKNVVNEISGFREAGKK